MENIVVITGAGVSVESGIQPFRGKSGIWEENPMEMATYNKFRTDPGHFLKWYYTRFISCKDALPNHAHEILANKNVKVITQNIDNLHLKANHSNYRLIEIHGNINYKRKINAVHIEELEMADWQSVREDNLKKDLFGLFKITEGSKINEKNSYRPHVLLFDENYTELYQYEKAISWILSADTIIFMGTSNSVGFTSGALQIGVSKNKKVIVVDPNPSPSFIQPEVELFKMTASDFCKMYF
jgi:NAD-dependent deacetylase